VLEPPNLEMVSNLFIVLDVKTGDSVTSEEGFLLIHFTVFHIWVK